MTEWSGEEHGALDCGTPKVWRRAPWNRAAEGPEQGPREDPWSK